MCFSGERRQESTWLAATLIKKGWNRRQNREGLRTASLQRASIRTICPLDLTKREGENRLWEKKCHDRGSMQ